MTYKAANTVNPVSMGTSDYVPTPPSPSGAECDNLLHPLILRPITVELLTRIAPICEGPPSPYTSEYTSEYK